MNREKLFNDTGMDSKNLADLLACSPGHLRNVKSGAKPLSSDMEYKLRKIIEAHNQLREDFKNLQ